MLFHKLKNNTRLSLFIIKYIYHIVYHEDRYEKISALVFAHCVVDETDWINDK